jgi:hypothetical protein
LSFRSEAEESAFALACPFLFVIPEGNLLFVRSHMHYTNDENALVSPQAVYYQPGL